MFFRLRILFLIFFVITFCFQRHVKANDIADPQLYLMKAFSNIERLSSGELDIHIEVNGFPSFGKARKVVCFLAFDILEDRYFYRRSDERNEYANDGESFCIYDPLNSHVSIRHPAMGGYSSSPRVKLDPRSIGIFTYRMLWQNQSYSDSKKMFLQRDFVNISQDSDTLAFEASMDRKDSHGYSTRQVVRVSRDTGNIDSIFLESFSYDASGKAVLSWSTDKRFSWKEVEGVFVLSHFAYESKIDFAEDGVDTSGIEVGLMSVRLDWKSVNKEMSQDAFSYKAFDLGDDADVWDLRGSDPVLVMSRPNSVISQSRKYSKEVMTYSEKSYGVAIVLIANVLFFLFVFVWLWVKRKWRRAVP